MGNTLLKILIAQYIVLMVAYAVNRDLGRALYFLGAAILSVGVLYIR